MGLYCVKCGGNHLLRDHNALLNPNDYPLETPSHNGIYQGTATVRVLAPGVSFEDDQEKRTWVSGERGRARRTRAAMSVKAICAECNQPFEKPLGWNRKQGRHCSERCYMKAWKRRREAFLANQAKGRRKSAQTAE